MHVCNVCLHMRHVFMLMCTTSVSTSMYVCCVRTFGVVCCCPQVKPERPTIPQLYKVMQHCRNKQLPSEMEVSILYVKVGDACSCSVSLAYLHFICACMVWSGHTNAIKECRPITVRLHVVIQSKSITEVYTVNLQHRSTCVHCLSHSVVCA